MVDAPCRRSSAFVLAFAASRASTPLTVRTRTGRSVDGCWPGGAGQWNAWSGWAARCWRDELREMGESVGPAPDEGSMRV